jgi:hypothetical protein
MEEWPTIRPGETNAACVDLSQVRSAPSRRIIESPLPREPNDLASKYWYRTKALPTSRRISKASSRCDNLNMPSTSDKWKHFERLVTAIHQAADDGADVRWNDSINGREFDVTIRFRRGLYDYLTVIECKDYEKPVPVEKVEAFVTKSLDAHAHHAVMASTTGFQRGARDVAQRHNITLIHVTDSEDVDLALFRARWTGTTDALHIQRIELEYVDGEKKPLPEAADAMTYYVKHILLQCGADGLTLDDLIECHSPRFHGGALDAYKDHIISCRPGTCVAGPDDGEFPLRLLARVHVRVGMTNARVLTSPVRFETHLLVPGVKVKNVATGEVNKFSRQRLPLGVNTEFSKGTFYEQPSISAFYYCDGVKDNTATIYLVESFQTGELIQAQLAVNTENARFYIPVSDKAVIQRLQRRLDRLKHTTG